MYSSTIVLSCFLTLPCFLSFFIFVYEIIVVLCVWLCGKKTNGIIKSFSWPVRDGLTYLWICNRSKWQAVDLSMGEVDMDDNVELDNNIKKHERQYKRPQIWWVVYKPLGTGIGTFRRSILDSSMKDNANVNNKATPEEKPTFCNRFCRQTGYHLSRIEMPYQQSVEAKPYINVDMVTFSFLCCTRADLKPNCGRVYYILRMFIVSMLLLFIGIGICLITMVLNNNLALTSSNVGLIIVEGIFWPLITSLLVFLLLFMCNCLYLRLEQYPTRFFQFWRTTVDDKDVNDNDFLKSKFDDINYNSSSSNSSNSDDEEIENRKTIFENDNNKKYKDMLKENDHSSTIIPPERNHLEINISFNDIHTGLGKNEDENDVDFDILK